MYEVCEEKLVGEWSDLVYKVIRTYGYDYDTVEDLYQIGVLGLLKANRKFDVSKNVKFLTYAFKCVNSELEREYIRRHYNKNKINELKTNISTDEYVNSDVGSDTVGDRLPANPVQYFGITYELVERLINTSGWKQRDIEVATMLFLQDMSMVEVAKELKVTHQRIQYQRTQLRDRLRRLLLDERFV